MSWEFGDSIQYTVSSTDFQLLWNENSAAENLTMINEWTANRAEEQRTCIGQENALLVAQWLSSCYRYCREMSLLWSLWLSAPKRFCFKRRSGGHATSNNGNADAWVRSCWNNCSWRRWIAQEGIPVKQTPVSQQVGPCHAHCGRCLSRLYTLSSKVKSLVPIWVGRTLSFHSPCIFAKHVHSNQDSTFLCTEPRQSCSGFWLALHDANPLNGCLWVRPKSHQEAVRRQFKRNEQHV